MSYVIGIDVGTGSVRGALVDKSGKLVKVHTSAITTWIPKSNFYQQSSEEIWSSCCTIVKDLIKDITPDSVKGLGFDATCSLAVLDCNGKPISVNVNDGNEQNVILWMDHRASQEAEEINKTGHEILQYVGGSVSLEMMLPKVLWLKNNHPECFQKAKHFLLIPDFLTWKATGETHRSLCSLVCKCNYEHTTTASGWNKEFFSQIGLAELAENNWQKIGSTVIRPGEFCGKLTTAAAKDLGLVAGIPVAGSLIDAHAGGLGVMGCHVDNVSSEFISRLALVCGTSTCHMAQTKDKIFVPGVWGPYLDAMIPGLWLLEGGQSTAGKLLDYIINTHPISKSLEGEVYITQYLNDLLYTMTKQRKLSSVDELTNDLHVWPDFHGNRSPVADPTLRGMISGLSLATDEEDLAVLYLATVQALAYGTKHIIDSMVKSGHNTIESVIICGGLSKNELFVNTHANALGLRVLIPDETESVLLGAAQLGAAVAGFYPNIHEAMLNMAGPAKNVEPDRNVTGYHAKKYKVFLEMLKHQIEYRTIMNGTSG